MPTQRHIHDKFFFLTKVKQQWPGTARQGRICLFRGVLEQAQLLMAADVIWICQGRLSFFPYQAIDPAFSPTILDLIFHSDRHTHLFKTDESLWTLTEVFSCANYFSKDQKFDQNTH